MQSDLARLARRMGATALLGAGLSIAAGPAAWAAGNSGFNNANATPSAGNNHPGERDEGCPHDPDSHKPGQCDHAKADQDKSAPKPDADKAKADADDKDNDTDAAGPDNDADHTAPAPGGTTANGTNTSGTNTSGATGSGATGASLAGSNLGAPVGTLVEGMSGARSTTPTAAPEATTAGLATPIATSVEALSGSRAPQAAIAGATIPAAAGVGLAFTGAAVSTLVIAGLLLLLVGLAITALTRRRRSA